MKQRPHQQHVGLNDGTMTGIKHYSCVNTLELFHVTENVGVDVMHYVLEGVAPLEFKLLQIHYIYEAKLLCLELNIQMKEYSALIMGIQMRKTNPMPSGTAIRLTVAQMWCLIPYLYFLETW